MAPEHGVAPAGTSERSGERALSQRERFKVMTAAERFDWWVGMLQLTFSLATPEVRDRWRKHRR